MPSLDQETIRYRALETASTSLAEIQGTDDTNSIKDEIEPAIEFLSMHCRDAVIEMFSSRFKPEITAVNNQAVVDPEAQGYNKAIMDMIEFIGGK